MTKTAYEKAIATRKKHIRDKRRVAKKRSKNARRAALIRWGKWDHKKNKPKVVVPKKRTPPPAKKKSPPPKTRRKTRAELERELEIEKKKAINEKRKAKRKLEIEKQKAIDEKKRAKRKLHNEKRKRELAEEKRKWLEEGLKDVGLGPEQSRFIQLSHLPHKLPNETDERYAERIVRQLVKEDVYTIEEAYKTLAEELEMSTKSIWSLWMSPKPIPSVA